ncbi:aldehyde dehydrogenase [Marivita sp.]|uniref:aldehyde dehydrogenase n=1 Tax=Marivita sp. TaxID=2003365 RepID=UPI003F715313
MIRTAIFSAACLGLGLTCSATAQDSDQSNVVADIGDVGALYSAEGAGVTYDYCASCHSTMLIAQQGQTREGWDELFEWMVEKQGMEPIPEEDRTKILDYLETHYNTDRPHFP